MSTFRPLSLLLYTAFVESMYIQEQLHTPTTTFIVYIYYIRLPSIFFVPALTLALTTHTYRIHLSYTFIVYVKHYYRYTFSAPLPLILTIYVYLILSTYNFSLSLFLYLSYPIHLYTIIVLYNLNRLSFPPILTNPSFRFCLTLYLIVHLQLNIIYINICIRCM